MSENNIPESFAESSIKEWGHCKLNEGYDNPDKKLFSLNDIRSFGDKIILDLGYEQWHKEDTINELNSYRLLFSFISDDYGDDIGYVLNALDAVNFEAAGYVKDKINADKILTFQHPKTKSWYHAKWDDDKHYYAEHRRGYLEDEFSGVIVFPSKKKDEFFVIDYWT